MAEGLIPVAVVDGVGVRAEAEQQTDLQLLDRYRKDHDQRAFDAILRRHGPLVLGVCRRVLRNSHDAEDAFQATFLVLVRKAALIGRGELLANWLYGVAYRTALKARTMAGLRRFKERQVALMPVAEPTPERAWTELEPVLDEELHRLPDKYRVPLVLCYLQGMTKGEAAKELGCPEGTVSGRLARAREMLRQRLSKRGLPMSLGLLLLLLGGKASAAVPEVLFKVTAKAAASYGAGSLALIPPAVLALAQGMAKPLSLVAQIAIAVLALSLIGGSGAIAYHMVAPEATRTGVPPGGCCLSHGTADPNGQSPTGFLQRLVQDAKEGMKRPAK